MKKRGLQLTGRQKYYFLMFAFFIFPNFNRLLSKISWKNPPLYNFKNSYEVLYVTNF